MGAGCPHPPPPPPPQTAKPFPTAKYGQHNARQALSRVMQLRVLIFAHFFMQLSLNYCYNYRYSGFRYCYSCCLYDYSFHDYDSGPMNHYCYNCCAMTMGIAMYCAMPMINDFCRCCHDECCYPAQILIRLFLLSTLAWNVLKFWLDVFLSRGMRSHVGGRSANIELSCEGSSCLDWSQAPA